MSRWMVALLVAFVLSCFGFIHAQAETSPEEPKFRYWYIDPHDTMVRFSAVEFGMKKVKGAFNTVTGTVEYDGKSAESVKVHVEVDVDTLDTNIRMRDRALKGDGFLSITRYPFIVFDSTRIVATNAGHFRMYGNLKIRQNTKEVVLEVNGPGPFTKTARDKTSFLAHATTKVSRKDFGIVGSGPIVVISDDIPIVINVHCIEGVDPEAGLRDDARTQAKKDFEQSESIKKFRSGQH
jgi:polyisoprenoid-binding protein YceI